MAFARRTGAFGPGLFMTGRFTRGALGTRFTFSTRFAFSAGLARGSGFAGFTRGTRFARRAGFTLPLDLEPSQLFDALAIASASSLVTSVKALPGRPCPTGAADAVNIVVRDARARRN
jgi:hypothetical protein